MTEWWRARLVLFAVAFTAAAAPAFAKDKPKPSLAIEPISARGLLAPAELNWKLSLSDAERERRSPSYRIGGEPDLATGQRARLSVELGDTTVFAVRGTLSQRDPPRTTDPVDGERLRPESGRIYGGGIERRIGPVELTATYQYSRANRERSDSNLRIDNPKSHNVRATARIKFRH